MWKFTSKTIGLVMLAALVGCGGGGGGGGGATDLGVYDGVSTPADLSSASSGTVAETVMNAANLNAAEIARFSKAGGQPSLANNVLTDFVNRAMGHKTTARGKTENGPQPRFQFSCGSGGFLDQNDATNMNGEGVLSTTYTNCNLGDGVVINGLETDNTTFWSTDGNVIVGHYSADVTLAAFGATYHFKFGLNYNLNGNQLKDALSGTFELWDATNSNGFRVQNLVEKNTFTSLIDWNNDCIKTSDLSTRIFDGQIGYLDVNTTTPLSWTINDCSSPGPSSGGPLVMTGANGAAVAVTPLNDFSASVAIDPDGDGVFEAPIGFSWAAIGFI
jgi:hypothetical protein